MAVLADLRYSARSFTRAPGLTLALVLTIALGIGSNASVYGFVRGLIARDLPIPGIDTVVSVFAQDAERAAGPSTSLGAGPMSYDDYLSLANHTAVFEWIGAARESQGTVALGDRPAVMSVAAITSDLAALLTLDVGEGVVISHRVWMHQLRAKADIAGERIRVDGVDRHVAAIAPDWLDGLYAGRPIDIWMALDEASLEDANRSSRSIWPIGRLRPGVSSDKAQTAVNAARSDAYAIGVLPYTGMTPEMTSGLARIGTLLGVAAGAVFFIACANVASFLLARASARSRETSVRVALGARRGQLARQLLSDSVLISVMGGACGLLLAVWTAQVIPALFFDQDAEHLVFVPDRRAIFAASALCAGITIACGLLPLAEIRDDQPAAVLRRESAGPSPAMQRLRAGLVVAQLACCCLLVISTALLLQGFRTALQTNVGQRLGVAVLVSVQAAPTQTRTETTDVGLEYFRKVEEAARTVPGISSTTWTGKIPGGRAAWLSLRTEPPKLATREVTLDVTAFTPQSLALITLPPVAGRMFGLQDTSRTCKVAIVDAVAAVALFDGDAVGRSIEDPAGERIEIAGVVTLRKPENAAATSRPTIFYYADQTAPPLDRVGPGQFLVPRRPKPARAVLDANIVSSGYFDTMDLAVVAGKVFPEYPPPRACRVAVVNQEAADRYFGGNAVGAAVIDNAGRRTDIIGVVHSALLRTFQPSADPAIYFPIAQDFRPRMTLILGARDADDAVLRDIRRVVEAVPGRAPFPVIVTTLDTHLSRTALAPLRIATTLVGASAAIALTLGVLGLYGAMTDAARRRRREVALRIALGAQGWRVIRQVLSEGVRLASAGTVAGMLGSLVVARLLARITPGAESPAVWVWLAAPLVLIGAVAVASVLPARRALRVDPLTIMRDDN